MGGKVTRPNPDLIFCPECGSEHWYTECDHFWDCYDPSGNYLTTWIVGDLVCNICGSAWKTAPVDELKEYEDCDCYES